ncbi:MAG: hypothetical protein ACE5FH_06845 [Candidatus Zixiibacteriota bacterium]
MKALFIVFSTVLIAAFTSFAADQSGRIYGVITTVDGDEFTGLIRWDKNEACWVDVLDGTKELSRNARKHSKRRKYRGREASVEIFGLRIGGPRSHSYTYLSGSAQSGIRFGHIQSLEPTDDNEVLLVLKSGEKVEFSQGSTDIGEDIREIVIEDEQEGEIELAWDDIERIDFMSARSAGESHFGNRLYGTLETRRGDEYTGFVCWDYDEVFSRDILDGNDRSKKRKIKFDKIAAIERYSSNGSTVILKNGTETVLKGSNDVDDGNRGIVISNPDFGQVIVQWDEFERLDFSDPAEPVKYDDFDGGHPLQGTVFSEDGDSYTGRIRWDNDEEQSWEILDGEYRDVQFDIEFSRIRQIEKRSRRSSIVTLWDGRSFRLSGSNDVDDDNKGIFIELSDGDVIEVEWDEFEKVEFSRQ